MVLAIAPIVIVGVTNYSIDPLQIYRKQLFGKPSFWADQRSQNAGKIRNYMNGELGTSILLGNSVADNFLPSQIEKYLGWDNCIKLTVSGGEASEQAFMLDQALRMSKIKHVLWVIRPRNFTPKRRIVWHRRLTIPFYLYSETLADDDKYLFSLDTFQFSLEQLTMIKHSGDWCYSLDRLNYWMSKKNIKRQLNYNSAENIEKLKLKNKRNGCRFRIKSGEKYPTIDHNILRLIRENQEIEFNILIAPHARNNLSYRGSRFLSRYFGLYDYLINCASAFPNMKIYGFDNDDDIAANLANYRDAIHYHSGVNIKMLKNISNNNNILTIKNIENYISVARKKLCSYQIYSDFKTMIPMGETREMELFMHLKNKPKSNG